ncbi:hypothetical protein BC826DRAFT_161040 [Russula brevipes]|nr:hypothetical protein BC826DRAFT_161040 [Russula brevipes]
MHCGGHRERVAERHCSDTRSAQCDSGVLMNAEHVRGLDDCAGHLYAPRAIEPLVEDQENRIQRLETRKGTEYRCDMLDRVIKTVRAIEHSRQLKTDKTYRKRQSLLHRQRWRGFGDKGAASAQISKHACDVECSAVQGVHRGDGGDGALDGAVYTHTSLAACAAHVSSIMRAIVAQAHCADARLKSLSFPLHCDPKAVSQSAFSSLGEARACRPSPSGRVHRWAACQGYCVQ